MTLFFGMCAFTLAVWDAGHSTAKNGNRADHHTQEYRKQADRDIKNKCTSSDVAALRSCIQEIVETTNEHERDEDDLHAQRDMAKWALLMLAATIAAAFAAFIGVVFIWNDTRVARKIGQAGVRAYVSVTDVELGIFEKHPFLIVRFILANKGNSPAIGTVVSYNIEVDEWGPSGKTVSKNSVLSQTIATDLQSGFTGPILELVEPFDLDAAGIDTKINRGFQCIIEGDVTFTDVFDVVVPTPFKYTAYFEVREKEVVKREGSLVPLDFAKNTH